MHRGTVFFGGVVAGGVLAAACGLDLFREDRGRETQLVLERLKNEVATTRELLNRSEELLRESSQKAALGQEKLVRREAELAALAARGPELAGLKAEVARGRAEAGELRSTLGRFQAEAEKLRQAWQQDLQELEQWRRLVHEQALTFFSRERDEWDAQLASQYLQTQASKESQQELLLALIARNKSLLLHLLPPPVEGGGLGASGAAQLAPATTGREAAEVQPATEGSRRP